MLIIFRFFFSLFLVLIFYFVWFAAGALHSFPLHRFSIIFPLLVHFPHQELFFCGLWPSKVEVSMMRGGRVAHTDQKRNKEKGSRKSLKLYERAFFPHSFILPMSNRPQWWIAEWRYFGLNPKLMVSHFEVHVLLGFVAARACLFGWTWSILAKKYLYDLKERLWPKIGTMYTVGEVLGWNGKNAKMKLFWLTWHRVLLSTNYSDCHSPCHSHLTRHHPAVIAYNQMQAHLCKHWL